MKKFLCCVLIIVIAASMTNAFCESLIVVTYSYKVSPAIVDGEIVLKITFVHDTDFLSFYWDDELQNMPLWVKIENNQCVDAGYMYKIPEHNRNLFYNIP